MDFNKKFQTKFVILIVIFIVNFSPVFCNFEPFLKQRGWKQTLETPCINNKKKAIPFRSQSYFYIYHTAQEDYVLI